ncbi:MAG TPA: hypothetical protein VD966_15105 [Pyrinomonadaceae bacterium]|nr:hypothetical protein [Pyrinomonadaceae bacterium]
MRKHLFVIITLALASGVAPAQQNQTSAPPPSPRPAQTGAQARPTGLDLSEYGVRIQPEPRLIVMMAALDAAGFDPTPAGAEPSFFRAQVRKDQAGLDRDLRARLRAFYERNRLPAPATPAEQAARYVSLAYALGPPPAFEAPARTEDLPADVLDVLDFAPLLREFYRQSGIEERLPSYTRSSQAEGDRLRGAAAEMVRSTLSYLHTRPMTTMHERVPVQSPATSGKKKSQQPAKYTVRERERRFFIVPDLLAVPGAVNFRVIADDYYVVLPFGANPNSSEMRRAYLQYVVDPLVVRFNRDIAARRDAIKQLLNERTKAGTSVTPDVFLAVARSLVAAADVRLEETARLEVLARETRSSLERTKEAAAREAIIKESQAARAEIEDEAVAQLADAYERGAVLAFYFADQLRGIETSGFDVANFFADMIASFDPARESRRPAEYAAARQRALAARQARLAQMTANTSETTGGEASRRAALVKSLLEVEEMLRLKNYDAAEARLRALLQEYQGEPRIFFALGRAASLSAQEATDEVVQSERLNRALVHYRMAIERASADTDRALLSRAHEAMGRILEFLERPDEAIREFDAAIKINDVPNGAYKDALEGKKRLTQPE